MLPMSDEDNAKDKTKFKRQDSGVSKIGPETHCPALCKQGFFLNYAVVYGVPFAYMSSY